MYVEVEFRLGVVVKGISRYEQKNSRYEQKFILCANPYVERGFAHILNFS